MSFTGAEYLLEDHPRTLFPLDTTRILVSRGSDRIYQHIKQEIKPWEAKGHPFLPQLHCYAAKQGLHLRRTVKLDPVAELFIYDLVLANTRHFKKDTRKNRRQYGYYFEGGKPTSSMTAYREFKRDLDNAERNHAVGLQMDVASYFNSVYHHDLVNYFQDGGWDEPQTVALNRFLGEITGGRSIDCLPHGLHPCKVLGSAFLHIVDRSSRLRSPTVLRFLDDIHVFAHRDEDIWADLLEVQRIIGAKGLSLNAEKTTVLEKGKAVLEDQIDEIKIGLLRLRSRSIEVSGEESEEEEEEEEEGEEVVEEYDSLSEEQTAYLLDLLRDPALDESDAELVLTLLSEHGEEIVEKMAEVWPQFPSLSKPIYNFVKRDLVAQHSVPFFAKTFLATAPNATEYQLFWLAKMLQEVARRNEQFGVNITRILDHPNSTPLVRAKVLEIGDNRFGLAELREQTLSQGQADWPSWAAAVGSRVQTKASRNKIVKNFGGVSPINRVVADIVMKLDHEKADEPPDPDIDF